MALHIECGKAGIAGGLPVEDAIPVWTETLPGAGTSVGSVPASGSTLALTVTADEDGWFSIGLTPDASTNPRRRILAGQQRSFSVKAGDKVAWLAS